MVEFLLMHIYFYENMTKMTCSTSEFYLYHVSLIYMVYVSHESQCHMKIELFATLAAFFLNDFWVKYKQEKHSLNAMFILHFLNLNTPNT